MFLMKQYITKVAGVVIVALSIVGCNRRATLTDNELAMIFHDAFLANAYATTEGISLDSLKLYESIFEKYGYTTEDVQYSIGNFSMRKSARLSDVVERSIALLERRGRELDLEVAILDTVKNIANRRAIGRIYDNNSTIRYRSMGDSTKMTIVVEPVETGDYKVSFDYLVDSLDSNSESYYTKIWVEEDQPEDMTKPRRYNESSYSLQKRNAKRYASKDIKVKEGASRLVAQLVTTKSAKKVEDPKYSVTVKRVAIDYHPNSEDSQDWIYQKLLRIRIFDDELLFAPNPQDSL